MATVRISIRGISKAYRLSERRIRARARKLHIVPKSGSDEDFPLYSEEDVKAITSYVPKKKKKKKRLKESKDGLRHKSNKKVRL